MKVRLLVARVGSFFTQNRGDEIEVGEAEAKRMISAGHAEAIVEPVRQGQVERAVASRPKIEKAVK